MTKKIRKHPEFMPASIYETPEFTKSMNTALLSATLICSIASYSICFLLANTPPSAELEAILSRLLPYGRAASLMEFEKLSYYSYISTVIAVLLFSIPVCFISCYLYWRDVLKGGRAKKLSDNWLVGLVFTIALMFFGAWIGFFHDPGSEHYTNGTRRFFIWPLFPVIGSLFGIFLSHIPFIFFGTIYKLTHGMSAGQKS